MIVQKSIKIGSIALFVLYSNYPFESVDHVALRVSVDNSTGGYADLLAVTYFLDRLETQWQDA